MDGRTHHKGHERGQRFLPPPSDLLTRVSSVIGGEGMRKLSWGRPKTRTSAMCPLRVLLLLWTLLCLGRGNVPDVQEEIFTRPGSDLLLPIRLHLTLSPKDGDNKSCDQFEWKFKDASRNETRIARHRGCNLTITNTHVPNTNTSENGSLIIYNVTLGNDGIYSVVIHNSTGSHIQTDDYTVHVEVPVSVPVLNVSCLRNGSAEISCRAEEGTEPNIRVSVIGGSPRNYSASSNNITAIVGPPGPLDITCSVENRVSQNMSKAEVTCPVSLSDIAVTSSCLQNGSAKAVCSVNGSDPRYSWSLDEESKSNESWVTLPPPVNGTLRCDVTNTINTLSTSINIYCTVPVSDPVLNVTCLDNGTSEISCRVEKGTDLSIFLTVIGGSEGYNVSSSERTVHVTVPPVSPPDSWNISCLVKNNINARSTNEIPEPCLAPLSTPHVNVSCHADGGASVSCVLEEDRDVTYNWTVNGELHGDHSRNITLSHGTFPSGPLNVSCSVYRKESREESNKTQIYCPAPLSTPHVNVSCHTDGGASVSCVLEEDRDVTYNWTVNGELHGDHSRNITFNKELNSTVPMNISCSVYNSVSTKESNKTQISCPDQNSTSCLTCVQNSTSCLQNSLIGGTVALMVTMPPLFIAHWYILRGMNKKS